MSLEIIADPKTRYWISTGLVITFFHYSTYLWPLLFDDAVITRLQDSPEFLEGMRIHLAFFIAISTVAILFAFKQFKYWRVATLLVCLLGIYNGETVDVFHYWFKDIDSFEQLSSRWESHSKYPWLMAAGFRNGIFIPLLYLAVVFLTIKDLNLRKNGRGDI